MAARQAVQKEEAFRRCGAARPRQRGRLRMCTHGTVLTLPQRRQGHWNGCVAQEKAGKGGRREADRRTRMWCVGSRDVRKRAEEWRGAHPRGLSGRGSWALQSSLNWRASAPDKPTRPNVCIRMCMYKNAEGTLGVFAHTCQMHIRRCAFRICMPTRGAVDMGDSHRRPLRRLA